MKTSGEISSIKECIEQAHFEVPEFQRSYSWEQRQVDDLWNDLEYLMSGNKSSHFLGSLIIYRDSDESGQSEIIDGQQRLSTITMLISILRDKVEEQAVKVLPPPSEDAMPINVQSYLQNLISDGEQWRFKANHVIRKDFTDCILRTPGHDPSRRDFQKRDRSETRLLRKAYWRLQHHVNTYISKYPSEELESIFRLSKTLLNSFKLLRIETNSQEEAINIYMTLNNRGIGLAPSDLVKSLMIRFIANGDPAEVSGVVRRWDTIRRDLGDSKFDQFLRHYLLLNIPAELDEHGNKKYVLPVRSSDIFPVFESIIRGSAASPFSPGESQVIAREHLSLLEEYAQVCSKILEPADSFGGNRLVESRLSGLNKILDSHRIVFMALFKTAGMTPAKDSVLELVFQRLETLVLRWLISGSNAQDLENLTQTYGRKIIEESAFSYDFAAQLAAEIKTKWPSDSLIESRLREPIDNIALSRHILLQISEAMGLYQYNLIPTNGQDWHVEHIAPQGPGDKSCTNFPQLARRSFWTDQLEENSDDPNSIYDELSQLLGNLTVISKKLNLRVQDDDWNRKKSEYSLPQYVQLPINKCLNQCEKWNLDSIDKRTEWLISIFKELWGESARPVRFNAIIDFSN
jgi:hypothetical protein